MSMKCIMTDKGIFRLPTNQAQIAVTAGVAVYVCKGIWKAWKRELNERPNTDQTS